MMRGYNKLIIGEDTGTHQNDVIWLYDFAVSLLVPHLHVKGSQGLLLGDFTGIWQGGQPACHLLNICPLWVMQSAMG